MHVSIPKLPIKRKIEAFFLEKVFSWLCLGLLLTISAGAGGLKAIWPEKVPILLYTIPDSLHGKVWSPIGPAVQALPNQRMYVASRTGKTYGYPWCGSFSKLAENQKRYFESAASAERAGYRAAKNCADLPER